jgi:hypothetical protein
MLSIIELEIIVHCTLMKLQKVEYFIFKAEKEIVLFSLIKLLPFSYAHTTLIKPLHFSCAHIKQLLGYLCENNKQDPLNEKTNFFSFFLELLLQLASIYQKN